MIYALDITTPKETDKTSPLITPFPLTRGLIYKLHLFFPRGSAGLMGVAIFKGGFQIWPSSRDKWFIGDNNIIEFEDTYLLDAEPVTLTVKTYNEDDTYEHEILIRIGLVSKNIFMARYLPSYAYEEYRQMLKKLEAESSEERQKLIDEMFPILR